jgi:hypothetical protein
VRRPRSKRRIQGNSLSAGHYYNQLSSESSGNRSQHRPSLLSRGPDARILSSPERRSPLRCLCCAAKIRHLPRGFSPGGSRTYRAVRAWPFDEVCRLLPVQSRTGTVNRASGRLIQPYISPSPADYFRNAVGLWGRRSINRKTAVSQAKDIIDDRMKTG